MIRLSGRRGGIVCVAAVALSLTVAAKIGLGEESSAADKPEKIIATDYSNLQEAVDAAKELGVRHIYMPSGTYDIDTTLNLTESFGYHLVLEGAGWSTVLNAKTGENPAIDLTNSRYMILKNFQLTGSGSVGILMARKGPGQ